MKECNLKKKCMFNKEIDIEYEDFIIYNKHFYHPDCWVQKRINDKRNKLTYDDAIIQKDKLIKESKEIKLPKILSEIKRKEFFTWLGYQYNISDIPQYFFIKLSNIVNGKYEKITKKIPLDDIIDMWKLRIDYLNKVNIKNKAKNKILSPYDRLNYDLAILLRNYEGYLEWKNKQVVVEKENNIKIDNDVYNTVTKSADINIKSNNSNDIADILDELF